MSTAAGALAAPHQAIEVRDERERFAIELFDALWRKYRERVSYVRTYEQMVHDAGGTFVNDHIAFRTFAVQSPTAGICSISRIFEALGYSAANFYQFPDKHLGSIHYQHPNPAFPKLFISELKTWELPIAAERIIHDVLVNHRPAFADDALRALREVDALDAAGRSRLLDDTVRVFTELPWELPTCEHVSQLDKASQFGAWVLVHGYNVNHFTALINSHGVESLDDIEKTIAAMQAAGIPMKADIEGARGSKLRQSATNAVMIDVPIDDNGQAGAMRWTYAYFEIAERGLIQETPNGPAVRFEGFLGPQATQLFEMTKVK